MKQEVTMMAAPTTMQPGGYIPKAYMTRVIPSTPQATIETSHSAAGWTIQLSWACPEPVSDPTDRPTLYVDGCALLVPTAPDTPWSTMGLADPEKAVEAVLWRADREKLYRVRAAGLGTAERNDPPADWSVSSKWDAGVWTVTYAMIAWPFLEEFGQLAFAVWQGKKEDRAGLKSISPGWLTVEK